MNTFPRRHLYTRNAASRRRLNGLNSHKLRRRGSYTQFVRSSTSAQNRFGFTTGNLSVQNPSPQKPLPATASQSTSPTLLTYPPSPPSTKVNTTKDMEDLSATCFDNTRCPSHTAQENLALESIILQRIQTRLPRRIKNLKVQIANHTVELTGNCRTYYTKQMAQHVAMGVLDRQQLINSIRVSAV